MNRGKAMNVGLALGRSLGIHKLLVSFIVHLPNPHTAANNSFYNAEVSACPYFQFSKQTYEAMVEEWPCDLKRGTRPLA